MKHPVIKLAGVLMLISGLVILSQIRLSADYSVNSNFVSFYYFVGGIALIIFGLVALLYKRQSNYGIPEMSSPTSLKVLEEKRARERQESGVVISTTLPGGPADYITTQNDSMPAKPLDWWK